MNVFFFFLLISQLGFSQNNFGEIVGGITCTNGEPIPFAKVIIYPTDGEHKGMKSGVLSDFDGRFRLSGLSTGKYDLRIIVADYEDTIRLNPIEVQPCQITFLNTVQVEWNHDNDARIPELPRGQRILVDPFAPISIKAEEIRRH